MPEALRFEHPDERPVLFFLDSKTNKYPSTPGERRPHPRLSEEVARRLSKIILKYGGRLLAQDEREDTDVLIVDKAMEEEYALYYEHQPRPIVKTPKFIEECYKRKKFALYPQPKRPMGGQVLPKGKKKWTPFTPQEKEMLCLYIAHKVPENNAGGRRGNKIYQDLVAHAEKYPHGPWALAANHTWQAWREHYVKKRDEYDPLIDEKAKEEGITSQSKGTYNFDRRKQYHHGVQEREIESEDNVDDDDKGNNEQANEAVAPVGEGPASRTRRRTRADSNEQDEAQGEDGDPELDQGPPPKRRRTDVQQRDSEEEDVIDWDPAEQTYQNKTARSSDARPGPEDAGPSRSQPTPPTLTQETRASRSSVIAQPRPRPNPRYKKSPAADATPMNTQQTLVDPTSPVKASMRARRANQIEEDEADEESGSPPPSSGYHATAHRGRQRLRMVDVVVPLRQRTNEPQQNIREHSESAGSAEVEDMLPEGEEEEGNDPQHQEYVDEDIKEDVEDGKDTQEAEELLREAGDGSFDTGDDEMVERSEIEPDEEEDGDDDDETDSADQRALDSLNVEVSEANEADDVSQHAFEALSDEDDEEDNADIFGATPPAASSPSRLSLILRSDRAKLHNHSVK